MKQETDHTYTLVLHVHNQPGVLVRSAQVFARRGHNIEALTVTPDNSGHAQAVMRITAFGKKEMMSQIVLQLRKLIDVIDVTIHEE